MSSAEVSADRVARRHRSRLGGAAGWIALGIVVAVFPQVADNPTVYVAASALLVAAGATSLNLVFGYVGVLTLGQAAFLAIGAFCAGVAGQEGVAFPIVLVLAAVIGGLVGLAVALISLRWRGVYVVLGTLALHFIALFVLGRIQDADVGPVGFQLPSADFFGWTLHSDESWYYFFALFAGATILCVALLTRSHIGRAWIAVRHNGLAASALGVNLTRSTILGFTIGSMLTAIAGAVGGYFNISVSHDAFPLTLTFQYLSIVLIGGLGTLAGGLVGAIFYASLPYIVEALTDLAPQSWTLLRDHTFSIQNAIFGVAIIAVMLFEPGGMVDAFWRVERSIRRRLGPKADDPRRDQVAPAPPSIERPAPAAASTPDPTGIRLEVAGVEVVYKGTVRAVQGVDLTVRVGEVVGLLGANGAGKTSTLRAITGFLRSEHAAVRGGIHLDGTSLLGMAPYQVADRGVMLVPERDKVFTQLSVEDNLEIVHGASATFTNDALRDLFPALASRWGEKAGFLSGGEKQMLALARALRADPKVLLIDELSQGLAPLVIASLIETLRVIDRGGDLAILLVDESPAVLLELASRVYVMDAGRIVFDGDVQALADDDVVRSVYLGGSVPR